jgi:hypothetical protein
MWYIWSEQRDERKLVNSLQGGGYHSNWDEMDWRDTMDQKAFQEYYPDELSYCYGCGRRDMREGRGRSRSNARTYDPKGTMNAKR